MIRGGKFPEGLMETDLSGANLSGARGVTEEQLEVALTRFRGPIRV
jgi:hypothetical protein